MKSQLLTLGNHSLEWGRRTYVMGILNLTTDSFSGDGLLAGEQFASKQLASKQDFVAAALDQARRFVEQGADILDVGGESTRPGAEPVGEEVELGRVLPVVRALAAELDLPISVDTYSAAVAQAALEAGAHMINDVWGLHADPELAGVISRHGAPVILMHNRSSWAHAEIKERLGGRYVGMAYDNLLEDVKRELLESVALAQPGRHPR